MNLNMTTSFVAFTLAFACASNQGLTSEHQEEPQKPIYLKKNGQPKSKWKVDRMPSELDVFQLSDTDKKNSHSQIFIAPKKLDTDPLSKPKKMLSLDGGGVRGLAEITLLTILEAILNHEKNKALKDKFNLKEGEPLTLQHVFDVFGGTSTGAILAAGLASTKNYEAWELMQLYARYSTKIFDEQKRYGRIISRAWYGHEGVDNLLNKFFGKVLINKEGFNKELYVISFDCQDQAAIGFTTRPSLWAQEKSYNYDQVSAVQAIGASAAAPVYFGPRTIAKGKDSTTAVDGGLVANNPAKFIYEKEKIHDPKATFNIYSFGTGESPFDVSTVQDHGVKAVSHVIKNLFAAQSNLATISCRDEIADATSRLNSLFRLQPVLENGKDGMDNTNEDYLLYLIHKAFAISKGDVFKSMVKDLGFNMPTSNELEKIHQNILKKINTLSSKNYALLDELEKDWIIRRVLNMDMDFYAQLHSKNEGDFTEEETTLFLKHLIADLEAMKNQQTAQWLGYIKSFIVNSKETITHEIVIKGAIFHSKAKSLEKVSEDTFLKYLSTTEKLGEPTLTVQARISALFEEFRTLCGQDFPKHDSAGINQMALIYWKDKLSEIEGTLDVQNLANFHKNLEFMAQKGADNKSWTRFGKHIRQSREYVLTDALAAYLQKYKTLETINLSLSNNDL